ncbi:RHO3 [Microsporum canis CBS 113480]|uniref:RHO3 n=1 Tax=Arthroderma otae (strain ATCC MYA-4605 / CBS 113480) TaxID=554155 RepID=C5FZL4_ARTOC|nr:RHO3 [Microsporum canis CBS 113480]EEQ35317.1 RHO3 [Microsporum canis CBS 113480]
MPLCGGEKTVKRKLVLLGDGACGKTSLLNVFTRGEPTVFGKSGLRTMCTVTLLSRRFAVRDKNSRWKKTDIYVDNIHMELSLWDTAGQEEFDRLRALSYDDTQAIMLCFSVDSRDSLENVESKWLAEIGENCPGAKIVVVALKCDLREEANDEKDDGSTAQPQPKPAITYNEGLEVAKRINALRYLEKELTRHRMLCNEESRSQRSLY